jgi:hypothetical protein
LLKTTITSACHGGAKDKNAGCQFLQIIEPYRLPRFQFLQSAGTDPFRSMCRSFFPTASREIACPPKSERLAESLHLQI